MPSAAPLTVRTAATFSLLAACLTLAGCGNRGELYLPVEAGGEAGELVTGRSEGALPQTPPADVEAERPAVAPSDSVNAIAPPTSTSGGLVEGEGASRNDEEDGEEDEDERDGEDARGAYDDADGVDR